MINNNDELYDKCENMEQLFEKYYLPLKDNWDKLKEMLREEIKLQEETYKKYGENNINIYYASANKVVLEKMQELENEQ